MKNPFKIYLTHLQFYKGNPFTFFRKKKSTLKFFLKNTGKSLQKFFIEKIPLNFILKIQGNSRTKNFYRKIPVNFFRKKINFKIQPQKYPLGPTSWTPLFQKLSPQGVFENSWVNSPTCLELHSHKKIVVHFFIPMLLLPPTPSLIYLKLKEIKGPKVDHFHFHFTSLHFFTINFCGVVLVPRYRRLTFVESYSYLAIDD